MFKWYPLLYDEKRSRDVLNDKQTELSGGERMREIKFRMWNGERMFEEEELYIYPMSLLNSYTLYEKGCRFMQYTGLKDINGKEIYEGDIVKHKQYVYFSQLTHYTGEVHIGIHAGVMVGYDSIGKDVEVIGNIYDNPELLGVQE